MLLSQLMLGRLHCHLMVTSLLLAMQVRSLCRNLILVYYIRANMRTDGFVHVHSAADGTLVEKLDTATHKFVMCVDYVSGHFRNARHFMLCTEQ